MTMIKVMTIRALLPAVLFAASSAFAQTLLTSDFSYQGQLVLAGC